MNMFNPNFGLCGMREPYVSPFQAQCVTRVIQKEPDPSEFDEDTRTPMPIKPPRPNKYKPGERLLKKLNKEKKNRKKERKKLSSDDVSRISKSIHNLVLNFE
jgi:hypothetical protein